MLDDSDEDLFSPPKLTVKIAPKFIPKPSPVITHHNDHLTCNTFTEYCAGLKIRIIHSNFDSVLFQYTHIHSYAKLQYVQFNELVNKSSYLIYQNQCNYLTEDGLYLYLMRSGDINIHAMLLTALKIDDKLTRYTFILKCIKSDRQFNHHSNKVSTKFLDELDKTLHKIQDQVQYQVQDQNPTYITYQYIQDITKPYYNQSCIYFLRLSIESDKPVYKYGRSINITERMLTYKSKSIDTQFNIECILAVDDDELVYIEGIIKQYSIYKHEQHKYINQIELIKTDNIQKYINLVKYLSKLHYVKMKQE